MRKPHTPGDAPSSTPRVIKEARPLPRLRIRAGVIVLGALVLVVLALLRAAAVVIPVGHRGVVFDRLRGGVQRYVLHEGMNFINPFTASVISLSVQTHTYTMSNAKTEGQVEGEDGIQVKTHDGQNVTVDVSIRYHLDPRKVAEVYQTIGPDYESKVVLPTVRSAVRDVFSDHPAEAVYATKREEISTQMTSLVSRDLEARGLVLDEFLLRDINFTPDYFAAIENKQIEQQTALRKAYELEIAGKQAEFRRIQAEGEAAANDIRGEALRANPRVIQYDYVRKVAPNIQAMVVNPTELKSNLNVPQAPTR